MTSWSLPSVHLLWLGALDGVLPISDGIRWRHFRFYTDDCFCLNRSILRKGGHVCVRETLLSYKSLYS